MSVVAQRPPTREPGRALAAFRWRRRRAAAVPGGVAKSCNGKAPGRRAARGHGHARPQEGAPSVEASSLSTGGAEL
eukprot:14988355-Alexandrium_andersonii.AAC.1